MIRVGARVDAARKRARIAVQEVSGADCHVGAVRWAEITPRTLSSLESSGFIWYNDDQVFGKWRIPAKRIRRGTFRSLAALERAIYDYIEQHNANPKPFVWTADLADIMPKIIRAHETVDSMRYQ